MRSLWAFVGAILIGAGVWFVHESREATRLRASTDSRLNAEKASAFALREQTKAQTARADTAEVEIARLKSAADAAPPDVQAELVEIDKLRLAGNYQGALDAYLKLYGKLSGMKERQLVALAVCVLAMSNGYAPALQAA